MKTFMSLLKITLNVHFGISALKYRFTKEKKRLWEPILIILSIIIGGGTILTLYSLLLLGVFMGGQTIGHPEIVLTFAFMATQLLVLIFGIFYIMSAFYFSNDLNILIPLPLKPAEVLGVKFIIILISEYLVALPMLLPAFIIYGIGTWADIFYWLKGLILVLMSPVFPLVIAAIFAILLMRFVNIRKSKDLMVVVGSLLGLFAGLGINILTQSLPQGNEEEFIKNLIMSNTGLIEAIGNRFPPSIWATLALSSSGWQGLGYFLLFVGFSIVLLAILLWLGNAFFYKGYLSGEEIRGKAKALSAEDVEKGASKASSPVIALFKREWKLFMRTPIYVMNGLAGMIMVPFFIILPFATKSEDMEVVTSLAKDPKYALIALFVSLGLMLFASSMNLISCTSISREGRTFWISKIIPASPRDQILAKLLHSSCLSLVALIIIALPLYFLLGILLYRLIIIVFIGFLVNVLINIVGLIVDLLRPKLEWNDPQEAIKQNLNAFLAMIISLIIMLIIGGVSILLLIKGVSEFFIYGILSLIVIVLLVPSYYGLLALANKKYNSLEI